MSTSNLIDGLAAFKRGKMFASRVPYLLGFCGKGLGRIDARAFSPEQAIVPSPSTFDFSRR
jgi:hypothetical protein